MSSNDQLVSSQDSQNDEINFFSIIFFQFILLFIWNLATLFFEIQVLIILMQNDFFSLFTYILLVLTISHSLIFFYYCKEIEIDINIPFHFIIWILKVHVIYFLYRYKREKDEDEKEKIKFLLKNISEINKSVDISFCSLRSLFLMVVNLSIIGCDGKLMELIGIDHLNRSLWFNQTIAASMIEYNTVFDKLIPLLIINLIIETITISVGLTKIKIAKGTQTKLKSNISRNIGILFFFLHKLFEIVSRIQIMLIMFLLNKYFVFFAIFIHNFLFTFIQPKLRHPIPLFDKGNELYYFLSDLTIFALVDVTKSENNKMQMARYFLHYGLIISENIIIISMTTEQVNKLYVILSLAIFFMSLTFMVS